MSPTTSAISKLSKPILDSVGRGRGRRISKGGGKVSRCPNDMIFIVDEVVSGQYTWCMEPQDIKRQYKSLSSGLCRVLRGARKAASRTGHCCMSAQPFTRMHAASNLYA